MERRHDGNKIRHEPTHPSMHASLDTSHKTSLTPVAFDAFSMQAILWSAASHDRMAFCPERRYKVDCGSCFRCSSRPLSFTRGQGEGGLLRRRGLMADVRWE